MPGDERGVALAGALPYHWSSSDETVVRLAPLGTLGMPDAGLAVSDDEVRVVASGTGAATISLRVGELEREVDVSVVGGSP